MITPYHLEGQVVILGNERCPTRQHLQPAPRVNLTDQIHTRRRTINHLKDDTAQCPEICWTPGSLVVQDLGRHIRGRATELTDVACLLVLILHIVSSEHANRRLIWLRRWLPYLGGPEVGHFQVAILTASIRKRWKSAPLHITPIDSLSWEPTYLSRRLSGLMSRWITRCTRRNLVRSQGPTTAPSRSYLSMHVLDRLHELRHVELRELQVARSVDNAVLLLLLALVAEELRLLSVGRWREQVQADCTDLMTPNKSPPRHSSITRYKLCESCSSSLPTR